MKRSETKIEVETIRHMVAHRLKYAAEIAAMDPHPNEDTICAFVEGRLEETGSSQMISHLISCASCRQITAQLTRLESQATTDNEVSQPPQAPSRFQVFLQNVASRLTPFSEEDAVFAYQDPPELDSPSVEPEPEDSEQS